MNFQIPKKEESWKVFKEKVGDFFDRNKEIFITNIIKGFEEGEGVVVLEIPFPYDKKRFKEGIKNKIFNTFREIDKAWDFTMEIVDEGIIVHF